MAHNDRGSNRLLIEDQGDAFFVAMAVAEIVLGFIAIAAAVPGIDTGARRIFGVLLGGAVAVGLAWGSVTAFRRTLRLVTKTAADLEFYGEREWSLNSLVARLVTAVLGFWIGAAIVSAISGGLSLFLFSQLDNLWNRDYAQVNVLADTWEIVDTAIFNLAFVVGAVLIAIRLLARQLGRGRSGYVAFAALLGLYGIIAYALWLWGDPSGLLP